MLSNSNCTMTSVSVVLFGCVYECELCVFVHVKNAKTEKPFFFFCHCPVKIIGITCNGVCNFIYFITQIPSVYNNSTTSWC